MKQHIRKALIILSIIILLLPTANLGAEASQKSHTVKKGDTLWNISQRYGLSVEEVKELNKLKRDSIKIGQKLVVEFQYEEIHKVKKGDTLWNISTKYKTTVNKIKELNKLKNDSIKIGQELVVKEGKSKEDDLDDEKPDKEEKPNQDSDKNTEVYTVKKGDTLSSISREFGITVKELKSLNKLTSDALSIGQKLNLIKKDEMYVTTSNLNMREKGSTSSKVILTIPKGSKVKVLKDSGNWWKVEYEKKTGYSSKDYLKKDEDKEIEEEKTKEKATVTASSLNLRDGAGTNNKVITTMPKGSVVDVISENGQWWNVDYKGNLGWASSDYLTKKSIEESVKPGGGGKVIILDPGHGGFDSGAVRAWGMESQMTTDYANVVERELRQLGYTVYKTRNGVNDSCSNVSDSNVELGCRVDLVNKYKADAYVSIHMNSFITESARGTETYYYSGQNQYTNESKRLAESVHKSYQPDVGSTDRGVKRGNFKVVREANAPSILLEVGFISNRKEAEKLQTASVRNKVGKSIAEGIDDYFKK